MTAAYQVRSERNDETTTNIVAKRYRPEQFHSRALLPFRHGQGGGDDTGPRVSFGQRVDVISFVGVRIAMIGEVTLMVISRRISLA
jgi:hypothetical protein